MEEALLRADVTAVRVGVTTLLPADLQSLRQALDSSEVRLSSLLGALRAELQFAKQEMAATNPHLANLSDSVRSDINKVRASIRSQTGEIGRDVAAAMNVPQTIFNETVRDISFLASAWNAAQQFFKWLCNSP